MGAPYFTIGHSNRTSDAFIALLKENAITMLVDVRSVPRSRYNPQFNREALEAALSTHAIGYTHLPQLGGLRGDYAAYMQTPDFQAGIAALTVLHQTHRLAFMCAEANWTNCHRRHISHHLVAAGHAVRHIIAPGQVEIAQLPRQARLL